MKQRNFATRRPPNDPGHHIYGTYAILEWLHGRPSHLRVIHYDPRSMDRKTILGTLAENAGVSLVPCAGAQLTAMAGTARHQGVVAVTQPFPYAELDSIIGKRTRLLLVADRIQDPQNLGAVLRSAAAGGVGAVIIPRDGSSPVSSTVEAAAAGGAARVPVCRVTNIARTLRILREHGYWSLGLVPQEAPNLYELDVPDRLALVLGGEAGMRSLTMKHCELRASIPMPGGMQSLNAAVAAAIAIYELQRRWCGWRVGGSPGTRTSGEIP